MPLIILKKAYHWYEAKQIGLGEIFLRELEIATTNWRNGLSFTVKTRMISGK